MLLTYVNKTNTNQLNKKTMYYDDYDPYYDDEYAGTYAHDIAGFSDDEINEIFDGDPEAYWNID